MTGTAREPPTACNYAGDRPGAGHEAPPPAHPVRLGRQPVLVEVEAQQAEIPAENQQLLGDELEGGGGRQHLGLGEAAACGGPGAAVSARRAPAPLVPARCCAPPPRVPFTCHQLADAGQCHVVLALQGGDGAGGLQEIWGVLGAAPVPQKGSGAASGTPRPLSSWCRDPRQPLCPPGSCSEEFPGCGGNGDRGSVSEERGWDGDGVGNVAGMGMG